MAVLRYKGAAAGAGHQLLRQQDQESGLVCVQLWSEEWPASVRP